MLIGGPYSQLSRQEKMVYGESDSCEGAEHWLGLKFVLLELTRQPLRCWISSYKEVSIGSKDLDIPKGFKFHKFSRVQ